MSIAIFLNLAAANLDKAIAAVLILVGVSTVTLIAIRKIGGRGYSL